MIAEILSSELVVPLVLMRQCLMVEHVAVKPTHLKAVTG